MQESTAVRYLVEEAKADVNLSLQFGEYGSALAAACSWGARVVRYLVEEAEAEVNVRLQGGIYGSALAAAAGCGEMDVIKYLVEEGGANMDLPLHGREHENVFALAQTKYMDSDSEEIVQYLQRYRKY